MGYELIASKKKAKISEIHIGAFTWPIILQETGAGYVLGYGAGRAPASYVYRNGNNGSPVSNDGYKITSLEATMMAACMRGYVSVKRFINKEWDELPPEKREADELLDKDRENKLYQTKIHEDRLKQIETIAEFIEQSGGFKIT